MKKSVLIIGSGIGGLSTAVRLLSKGYKVKVYEKEKTIGGKTNLLVHSPFTFDLTASILINALKTKAFSTSQELISEYIKDEKLQKFLAYQSLYVGISPYEEPSVYTLVPVIS